MASFSQLPNEMLENVFQYLDFKNRKMLSPVCTRWNDILMSERYLKKHVILQIEGCRLLDAKKPLRRDYRALSIKLDNTNSNEMIKNLRLIHSICANPRYLRVENWSSDQRFGWLFEELFFNLEHVEQLQLMGTCKTEKGSINLQLEKLRVLKLEAAHLEYFSITAPNLTELSLHIRTEDDMDLLPHFAAQLIHLTVVFVSKDIYYFYRLKFPKLKEMAVHRCLKGMTRSEQNISIVFFKRLTQLNKLHLAVKFIDSYVLQRISESLSSTVDLSLVVSEGTIELSNISKLVSLEKLTISAEKVNLSGIKFFKLRELRLGSQNYNNGTYVYGLENLMSFHNLRVMALHNVKFYPEILKLTPSYNVETMIITHYKRLEENHLQILVRKFSAVVWLKIASCPGFTIREVEKLKRLIPKLCVAFDEVALGRL
ncbi:uncharacterized protein LOC129746578 [Uranotaenia lowii]|uniref:uncharacterized protein LOC129746578 n=1 Tax=Uranotaenia lowii TaxID=190385 RepID=UPI00247AB00A|nr:uncharacterized protein LOC129746578 [Uranotaenia lowii]